MSETEEIGEQPKKKRKKPPNYTTITLNECRKRGFTVQVVEKWVRFPPPGHRVDLFGCIDIIAITPQGILAIQSTSNNGGTHAAHRTKILNEPRVREWVDAGGLFELWSWSKRGNRWELRAEDMRPILRALAACVEARSES